MARFTDRDLFYEFRGKPVHPTWQQTFEDQESRILRSYNRFTAALSNLVDKRQVTLTSDPTINAIRIMEAATGVKEILLPAGSYPCAPLTLPMVTLTGKGTGVTILTFAGGNGITFRGATGVGQHGGVRRLTIATSRNGATGIKTPYNEAQYFTYRARYTFEDLEFVGQTPGNPASGWNYDYGWTYYIDLGDCWGAYIRNIDAVGVHNIALDPTTQLEHTFLRMRAAGGILTARIENVSVASVYNGIEISERCFWMMSGLDLIQMHRGIYSTGSSNTFSEGRISDSLINAQLVCLHLADSSWRAISNVAMGRHRVGYDHGQDWIGLHMVGMTKCWIENMRSQVDKSVTDWAGTHYGYKFEDCAGFTVSGLISGLGLDYGVHCDEAVQVSFDGCNFQGTSGTAWRFENSSRDITIVSDTYSTGWTDYSFEAGIDLSKYWIPRRQMRLETGQPYLFFRESDESADNKNWRITASNENLSYQVVSDDEASSFSYDITTRNSGTIGTPTLRELRATTIQLSGTTSCAGDLDPANDNSRDLGSSALRWRDLYAVRHFVGSGAVYWSAGSGSPEGVVTAPIGSLYSRTNGGAGTSLYVKESGSGNTGWVAK